MTIQNWEEYKNSLWDWSVLDGCFGDTRIRPTDIDGCIERKGKFLVLETKGVGVEVKQGQKMTFDAMIKTGVISIVVIWGEPGSPKEILLITRKISRTYQNANMDTLRNIVSRWFSYADSGS